MNVKILVFPAFEKDAKRLMKKYASLKDELKELENELLQNPEKGISIGNHCYKIRLAVKSKGKGKSGGLRIITYIIVRIEAMSNVKIVNLAAIYNKSDYENLPEKDIKRIIKEIEKNFNIP